MFDLDVSGFISKKDFKEMSTAIIRGSAGGKVAEFSQFDALADFMVDMAFSRVVVTFSIFYCIYDCFYAVRSRRTTWEAHV